MRKSFLIMLIVLCQVLSVFATNNDVLKLTWPDDFKNPKLYDGKIIELNQKLYITDISNWHKYGSITVARERLMAPTEIALPGSDEYYNIINNNEQEELVIDDGLSTTFPNVLPWVEDGCFLRTGAYIENITGRFNIERYGYTIVPTEKIIFENNIRPTAPENLGDYNLKICSFNLRIYLASNFGTGFGPNTEAEGELQHEKIINALNAIDADVFGLVEVQQGQMALQKLVNSLNEINPAAKYKFINDGSSENGSFVKSGFIYKSSRVTPVRQIQSNDTGVKHRKKAQCFEMNDNGEKFIMIINHFKSKSGRGTGENADKGDGQGAYNADRIKEATSVITFAKSCEKYFGDNDVIIMGDLNAYSMEDPIKLITREGYVNVMKKYESNSSYTFSFRGNAGCLDHALANESIERQITGCSAFHINSDESFVFSYDGTKPSNDMYRSSDHDPIVVGLSLGNSTGNSNIEEDNKDDIFVYGEEGLIGVSGAYNNLMQVINLNGRFMFETVVNTNDYVFSPYDYGLNNGVYIVKFIDNASGDVRTEKLIIK